MTRSLSLILVGIALMLGSASAWAFEKGFTDEQQAALAQENNDRATSYVESIPAQERASLQERIEGLVGVQGLYRVQSGSASARVFVLIHGINYETERLWWYQPLHKFSKVDATVYFYRWDQGQSLSKSSRRFAEALKFAARRHPGKTVDVISFCSGGIVTAMAQERLVRGGQMPDSIFIHTIATPFNGYGAPQASLSMGRWLSLTGTVEIGYGIMNRISHLPFSRCRHWVNTNCARDIHACRTGGAIPQILDDARYPCGPGAAEYFDDTTHASLLWTAVDRILSP